MADLIDDSFRTIPPSERKVFRIHAIGDFFSPAYFEAWVEVAKRNPNTLFYCYTKSVGMVRNSIGKVNALPNQNFRITFSLGGYFDKWVIDNRLKFADIVKTKKDAANYVWYDSSGKRRVGIQIAAKDDDSLAIDNPDPFVLVVHGVQVKVGDHRLMPKEFRKKLKNRWKMVKAGKAYMAESYNNPYPSDSIHYQIYENYLHTLECPKCSKGR
jgi:hypothetical protein